MDNKNKLKKSFISFFDFKTYSYLNWYLFFQLFISLSAAILCIADGIVTTLQSVDKSIAHLWFGNLDKFTQQTNILICIFVWLYFWKPNANCFKNNTFLMSCMTYIFITFVLFNGYKILLYTGLFSNDELFIKAKIIDSTRIFRICKSILNHLINPIVFIVYGFLVMNKKKILIKNIYRYISLSALYPIVYMLYLVYIPWSGYQDTGSNSYSVYDSFTQTKYNKFCWLWIPWMFISIPIVEYLICLVNNKSICKNKKNF